MILIGRFKMWGAWTERFQDRLDTRCLYVCLADLLADLKRGLTNLTSLTPLRVPP